MKWITWKDRWGQEVSLFVWVIAAKPELLSLSCVRISLNCLIVFGKGPVFSMVIGSMLYFPSLLYDSMGNTYLWIKIALTKSVSKISPFLHSCVLRQKFTWSI